MKRKYKVYINNQHVEREVNIIPGRYILAMLLTILETIAVIGVVIAACIYIPYFYIACYLTVVGVIIAIICSNDNPDYKIPWILAVLLIPIAGFMFYFLFYKRKLSKRYVKRIKDVKDSLLYDDKNNLKELKENNKLIYSQALELTKISDSKVYKNTHITYFPSGEAYMENMLYDLKNAKEFILFEYFIVENGLFWDSILNILKEKAKEGIIVKVMWDDIGCISTLPGNYYKELRKFGIDAYPFSRLKGQADSEFNNRNHRKILVVDGKVGYTGGINIADEYINHVERFGHWKDMGIRLEGEAVNELSKLFLTDFYSNSKNEFNSVYYRNYSVDSKSYVIPFGDGPKPIYNENVGKIVIMNMLNQATDYVYITTPYLIIDAELLNAIKNTSLRGVDVRIIVPHIPDKKIVFEMTKSNYKVLIDAGVKIYEYKPGFIHGKLYISDDKLAMIGTINLDYRSLVHHFENGVWIYNDEVVLDMKEDYLDTINKSIEININSIKDKLINKIIRILVKIFSPLL